VQKPDVSLGQANKDFGQGFYTTTSRRQAEDWARVSTFIRNREFKAKRYIPTVSIYKPLGNSHGLNVHQFSDSPTVEWLDFIIANRYPDAYYPFTTPLKNTADKLDVIIGPIANNNINQIIRSYLSLVEDGINDIERFHAQRNVTMLDLRDSKLVNQVFFRTGKAVDMLQFEGSVHCG
jgi:hypothetical protein